MLSFFKEAGHFFLPKIQLGGVSLSGLE
jgi:hypothetical protein